MIAEANDEVLVYSQITEGNEYTRQKDTIITWHDQSKEQEIALSFRCVEDTKKMM